MERNKRNKADNITFLILYSVVGSLLFWLIITASGVFNTYRSGVPFFPTDNFNNFTTLYVWLFIASFLTSIIGRIVGVLIIRLWSARKDRATKNIFEFNYHLGMDYFFSAIFMALFLTIGVDILLLNVFNVDETQIFSLLFVYILLKGLSYLIGSGIVKYFGGK